MARKIRSMFKTFVPQPGSGERPTAPLASGPLPGTSPVGAVLESQTPAGANSEMKQVPDRDAVARLAYERWLETGGGAVENWVWAEAEWHRRNS